MKRIALLSAVAPLAVGYSHGRAETVLVKGVKGVDGPVRINKTDFEADQEGEKSYTEYKGKGDGGSTGLRSDVNVTHNGEDGEVQTTAAPSAPDFSSPAGAATDPIDPVKQAAAPKSTTPDQLLVMKSGNGKNSKYFITDGMGKKIEGDQAKLLNIDEKGYDSEEAAKAVQTHTNPEPAPNK